MIAGKVMLNRRAALHWNGFLKKTRICVIGMHVYDVTN